MKDKNKKLIIVVAVLLLIVGVSFAYFVSTVLINGEGAKTKLNTASINGATITVRGSLTFNDLDIYPGHKNVSGIELTATGNGEFVPYNLVWEGTNSLNTPLNYVVYKSESEINSTATCNKTTKVENGAQILAEECSISNIEQLGSPIYSGTIKKSEEKVVLTSAEFITATSEGSKVYYYVILEYPNLEESQNIDIGGSFNGKVTVEENNSSADITIASIYKAENGEYKQVKDIPTKEERYILNTEKSTCSNNAKPTWNDETYSLQVSSLTISGTECNLYFDKYIDTEIPVITNVTTSVTKTEINVTVSATDNEGVTEYWYQLDSNPVVQGTGNTHKFTGLTAGTTYSIKVYVKDAAGNQSATTTKSVTTAPNTASDIILGNITVKTETPDFSQVATTDEGVYKVADGMYGGYSYYWRGAVTNNYIKFANFCWRIVRINGDGTIRLIYDGTSCHANGTITSNSVILTEVKYNTLHDKSYYVGWTYSSAQRPSTTVPQTSGTESNAKTQLEAWYRSKITGTNVTKVADGNFCNDRDVASGSTWNATGADFYYAGADRVENKYQPSLECKSGDIYNLKIGLITADEAMYAGASKEVNIKYYLYNGYSYLTITPSGWYSRTNYASIVRINANGQFGAAGTDAVNSNDEILNFRPVINLRSDITFSGGNGTQSNPYVVS